MPALARYGRSLVLAVTVLLVGVVPPASGQRAREIGFSQPVFVSQGFAFQAAEPSIRVDAVDPNQRIWIAAPQGILPEPRFLPQTGSGDLFWYSDDDGRTWRFVTGPGGVGTPTMVGGGDSDVATGFGPHVYGTGLTLANITLAASCLNGEPGTWTTNPVSNVGTLEDRQWIDTWEDHPKPGALAPDLVLDYGGFFERRMYFHQVFSAAGCAPPVAGPRLDVSLPECSLEEGPDDPDCYQWPGNIAIDETTGDVYVTYNTLGNDAGRESRLGELEGELKELLPGDDDGEAQGAAVQAETVGDDVIVARIAGGANGPVTQSAISVVRAAANRPDTFDSFTVVAVDTAGNLYLVWSERHPEIQQTDTMLSVSTNKGATWTSPVVVNRQARTTTFPWVVAGAPGRIDIVYYGTTARGPSPEEVPESSLWRVYMAQSVNALRSRPSFLEVQATPFMHQGSICTSGTACAPGTRDLLDFFQIDVDAQGLANIAYTDNLNTPPDGTDPHQEWVTFVQQTTGPTLLQPQRTREPRQTR